MIEIWVLAVCVAFFFTFGVIMIISWAQDDGSGEAESKVVIATLFMILANVGLVWLIMRMILWTRGL